MIRESQRIPVDDWTREVVVREVDGKHEVVLVSHSGHEDAVPVRLREIKPGRAEVA
jgi:hypothetical protein